nr:putative ribonuclease H-like domain-containing protein [Tanacetum cinerariifolium]
MQKYLLKQQFEGFSVSTSEGLDKGYDRFQTLLSQLEIDGAGVSHKDANQKFLRSLPSSWSQVALIMRTKPGLDTLSFDDLYNNLRVFERDVKGTTESSSKTLNVALMIALQLDYGDLEQINDDDMEEMDLKWQMAMISIRIKKGDGYNGNKNRDNGRRPTYQDDSKALVTIDGEDIDWSGHVEEDARNYTMMAYSSSNSGSDNESVFMNKESGLEDTHVNDRFADGMHTSTNESDSKPSKHAFYKSDSSVETSTSMPEPVENASKVVCKPKVWTDAPITEEYESDSDNDSVSNVQKDKEKPSFAFTNYVKHVKTSRENIKEIGTTNHSPKIKKQDRNGHTRKGLGYAFTRKACFVCGSFSHLIRDCDFHEKRMAKQAELTKSENKVVIRDTKEFLGTKHMTGNKAHLANYQEFKGGSVAFGGRNRRITGKGKIKTGRLDFEDVYYVEELKHYNLFSMLQMCDKKNKVLFIDIDCLVLSPDFKLPDENQVLLKIPRQHNMYSFNLKNIDSFGDLAFLFAKALIDESSKWHRRLGHVNFKNLNKFVKGNLLRDLPFKIFENDHTVLLVKKESNTRPLVRPRQVLVTKPQNKTPYELLTGKQPIISYLRPFGCHVTILNTIHQLGKFDRKSDSSLGDKIEKNTDFKTCEKPNASTSNTNIINTASTPLSIASHSRAFNDSELSYPDPSKYAFLDDPSMPHLEDNYASPSEGIFTDSFSDDAGVVTDFNNLEITKSWCDEFEELMKNKFQISSMGELTFFFRLQVKQKEDGIFICQDKYVAEILKKFDFLSVKTASTSIETQKPLVKDEEAADVDVHLYRSMIGSLIYLTASRPDIMFAVYACSRFQVTPKTSHLHAVKRIFRYLKGQLKLGLWYFKVSSFDLGAYSDSDYAGANLDRKSITGGCQFLARRLISWECKKQTIMATSTIEAKYVAVAHCCGQVLWIQNQLLDYGFNFMNTKIYIDNESTICIVKNLVFHSKTKHIEIRHHFIRDAYEKKLIQVLKIHTDDNVADLLTKAFDVSSSPCLMHIKNWLVQKQTVFGKDFLNPFMADNLPKKLYDIQLTKLHIKELASPKQTALGKDISNLLMAGRLLKTTLPTSEPKRNKRIGKLKNRKRAMCKNRQSDLTTAKVKTINDEVRIQALIDEKRVNIKESSIRRTLKLDDAVGTSCLANSNIFDGLAKMGYKKLYEKLTFYKDFFSPQWNFLIHTILQCLSVKTTSWNEFSSTMASTIICLAKNQKFNFSRGIGTSFSGVVTLLFDNMLVSATKEVGLIQDDVQSISIPIEPSTSKPYKKQKPKKQQTQAPKVPSPEPSLEHMLPLPFNDPLLVSTYKERIEKLKGRVDRLEEENMVLKELHNVHSKVDIVAPVVEKEKSFKQRRIIVDIDEDIEINLEEAQANPYKMDLEHPKKVLSMQNVDDEEPTEVEEVLEVVTAAKLITEVVTPAGATTTAKHYNYNQSFLEEVNEEVTVPEKEVEVEGHKREEATPLASNIPIVDYKIHLERNKSYFKIIRADGNHMLFLSFSTLLKNFDKEDLESLWKLVKERYEKTKPKNYTDDYLLKTLKTMFEQPDVEASVWRDQNGRLEVEEESEMSLELLKLGRRQLNEDYVAE